MNDRLKEKGALLGFPVNPSLNVGSIKGVEDMQQAIDEIHAIFKQVCSKYGTRNELTCNQYFNYWKVDKAHPVARTAGAKAVYYILINAAYWTFLTSAVIPHIALGSELTDDFEERTTLRTCANFLMNIGMLIALSGSLMIVQFFA